MRKFKVELDRFQLIFLKQILTDLVDKESGFRLESVAEQGYATYEAYKILRSLFFLPAKKSFHLQYYQLALIWKVIISYPVDENTVNAVRILIAPFDKHYLTIKQLLNYDTEEQVFESAANRLNDNSLYYGTNNA